jgi:hypothetical protein
MKRFRSLALLAICCVVVAAPRWSQDKPGPGRARITIYHIAPGKHLDFLKWMAAQDEVAKEAGIATIQLYAHLDGDSWDYVGIGPVQTGQEVRRDRHGGMKTWPPSLEFRQLVASHTDTFAAARRAPRLGRPGGK